MPSLLKIAAFLPLAGSLALPHESRSGASWAPDSPTDYNAPGLTAKEVMIRVQNAYEHNTLKLMAAEPSACTPANIGIRKEWGNLTKPERFAYLDAIECLHNLPPQTTPEFAPGAKSRWDDFVVAHILNTQFIHESGFLLPWHRELVWRIEQALRNECGYAGFQPYWDWSKYADLDPDQNPLYDGSETSMSGNGKYVPHNATTILAPAGDPPAIITYPPGTGGGCIYDGPLVNWTAELGPVDVLNGDAGRTNPQPDGLGANPRCLQRDFYSPILPALAGYDVVANGTVNLTSIHTFHPWAESTIHAAGHGFIGGENHDLYASPNDPLFFFHHANLDRIWAVWQSLDFSSRTNALDGTQTYANSPPSPNVTLDTTIYFSPFFANTTVGKAMSPTKNSYCYVYV